jgi:PAS domain S-box-containing protein
MHALNRLVSWAIALPIVVSIVGSLRITSLNTATEKERDRSLNEITQAMPQIVWTARPDGILDFSNQYWFEYTGMTLEESVGAGWKQIVHPDDIEESVARWADTLKSGLPYEIQYRFRRGLDKSFRWHLVRALPMRDDSGKIVRWVGTCTDIHDQKQVEFEKSRMIALEEAANTLRDSESKLRKTTRQLQTLIDSSPVAILTLDKENKVTVWNEASEKMFGWKSAEVIGKPLPFVQPEKKAESQKLIEKIYQTRELVTFQGDRTKKDGSPIKVATSAIPYVNEAGEIQGLMAVMIDETERYRAENEILNTNSALKLATQAKSEFLANMSHEIRTPINGVMGMTGLLLDLELGHDQRAYAETIRDSAEILLNLVNDILDFSKIEAGKMDLEKIDFDFDHLIRNIERLLSVTAKKRGLKLLHALPPEFSKSIYNGDPNRIRQILTNLISNAIKFTEKGHVMVQVIQSSPHEVRVEVSDTGIGMSPEAVTRMFQPFTQADTSTSRRFGGTGLGLSICKRLVEAMNGTIGVRSTIGKGSTFWFTVQLEKGSRPENLEDSANELAPLPSLGRPIRILLAEDNLVNQIITLKMLEKFGFRVDVVGNGNEALSAVHSLPYDLVLMDCQMPELDGYEATQKIRKNEDSKISSLPIVAMTANALSGDREKCIEAGMDDYVTKPIKAQDLAAVIHKMVSEKIAG